MKASQIDRIFDENQEYVLQYFDTSYWSEFSSNY